MNKLKKLDLISLSLVALTIVFSIIILKYLPDKMITHWDFEGNANGWSDKYFFTSLMSVMILFMYLLFNFLPKIDPKKNNYIKFNDFYKSFQLIIILFLFLIYILTILINLGVDISVSKVVSLMVGLLFIYLGIYMKKIKSNWFVGIRTPWTLSNDIVWEKTHKFGGKIFVIIGGLFLISSYLPFFIFKYIIYFIVLSILSIIIYSYYTYKQITK